MNYLKILAYLIVPFLFISCEDDVVVDLGETEPAVVIDAWIDNLPGAQTVQVTLSRDFYDVNPNPRVTAESVIIEDLTDPAVPAYVFTETETGVFQWIPPNPADSFGIVGHTYRLHVVVGQLEFEAFSTLNPIPPVDSIRYNYIEEDNFQDEGFEAEFFATDLAGFGNTYWIKGFKNGIFLDQPEYITTSFDGTFSESDQDGILFLPPLRTAINPFEDVDDDGSIDAPYEIGDDARVELLSVTEEAYLYLNEIQTQTDRQGGISELFAVPMTNLTGNIVTISGGEEALGFFSVSAVSSLSLELTAELAEEAIARD